MLQNSFEKNRIKLRHRRARALAAVPGEPTAGPKPRIDPVQRAKANVYLKHVAAGLGYANCSVWDAILLMEKHYAIVLSEIEEGHSRSKVAIAMAAAVQAKTGIVAP